MNKPTDLGMNRTGAGLAPFRSMRTAQAAEAAPASDGAFLPQHNQLLQEYASDLPPIGTMPPPTTVSGAVNTALAWIQGQKGTTLLDKIGERLAFERTGTRLWEGVVLKYDVFGPFDGGPSREQILEIRDQERDHFAMLVDTLVELGADPTVVTPSADLVAVESQGLLAALGDPRVTLEQALHVALVAELTDNAGWEMLADLARGAGQSELGGRFDAAGQTEATHLNRVRGWLKSATAR